MIMFYNSMLVGIVQERFGLHMYYNILVYENRHTFRAYLVDLWYIKN